MPWHTPITVVGNAALPLLVGLRTELVALHARDDSDLDAVTVRPLPSQVAVLDAFGRLDTMFNSLNHGQQALPWVSPVPDGYPLVLEFLPNSRQLTYLCLMFATDQRDLRVYLQATRRGVFGRKVRGSFHMTHEQAAVADWHVLIGKWLAAA